MRIILCVDGGPKIGLGHAARMGTLAAALLDRGHDVEILTKTLSNTSKFVPSAATATSVSASYPETLDGMEADVTVIDFPRSSESENAVLDTRALNERLSAVTQSLVVFDDSEGRTVACDVLVNSHLYAEIAKYDWVGPEPDWCLGTEYLIFQPEIRRFAAQNRTIRNFPERALVSIGGSDVRNSTPGVIEAFEGMDVTVDVIIGPGFSNRGEIRAAAAGTDTTITLSEDPQDLVERMFAADFAVSALGLMAYEFLALGTPFVGLPVAPDQRPKADALARHGAAFVLDDEFSHADVERAIETLAERSSLRQTFHSRGRGLVDPHGIDRVCDVIESRSH